VVRKVLYALIGISAVLVLNQITVPGQMVNSTSTVSMGLLEVRVSASPILDDAEQLDITFSTLEVHLPSGWAKLQMAGSSKFDLMHEADWNRLSQPGN
jgi:hypothetical protein